MLRLLWWGALLGLVITGLVRAEETEARPSLSALVQQLDAEEFATRQKASTALAERGQEALPALVEAAKSNSAEIATRAIEILRKHYQSDSKELKAAATEALQSLAKGEGAAARRAAQIVERDSVVIRIPIGFAPMPHEPKPLVPAPLVPRIRIVEPAGIKIIGAHASKGVRRRAVKDINGMREIEVSEHGRVLVINEDRAKAIKMKVVEKQDDKIVTHDYEADSAGELKSKHPEAYKLYEQYALQEGEMPTPLGRKTTNAVQKPQAVRDGLEHAEAELDAVADTLKKRLEADEKDKELGVLLEMLKSVKRQIEAARESLAK